RITFDEELSSDGLLAHVTHAGPWELRGEPYGVVSDSRRQRRLTSEERDAASSAVRDTKQDGSNCVGLAIVAGENGLSRTVISTVMLSARLPYPYRVFSDPSEAEEWLAGILTEHRRAGARRGH